MPGPSPYTRGVEGQRWSWRGGEEKAVDAILSEMTGNLMCLPTQEERLGGQLYTPELSAQENRDLNLSSPSVAPGMEEPAMLLAPERGSCLCWGGDDQGGGGGSRREKGRWGIHPTGSGLQPDM